MPITSTDLVSYFSERNNKFINATGMEFILVEMFGISTQFTFLGYNSGPYEMTLVTDCFNEEDFIMHFRLHSVDDIDRLGYNNSWMLYLNSLAEIIATPLELEADIGFRILGHKTIIFSMDLHYYDEAYEHLTLPEDFEKYLKNNEDRLFKISSIRYPLSPRNKLRRKF